MIARRPILTALAIVVLVFGAISLTIQAVNQPTKRPTPARVCTHHAHAWNTVYEPNSPTGHIAVCRLRSWCDEWSDR